MMINLPLKCVQKMASNSYIDKVLADVQTLRELTESIVEWGFHEPLEVKINQAGTCALTDGHHRLVIGSHIDYLSLPVVLIFEEHNLDYGAPASEVLTDILSYLIEAWDEGFPPLVQPSQ